MKRANGECYDCDAPAITGQQTCEIHRDARRIHKKRANIARKRLVLDQYGGVCQCCGEHRIEMLTVDHVDGGGSTHRKVVGSGNTFHQWLKRNKFPPGFQVLCFNCNCSKGANRECPHVTERRNKIFYTGIHNDSPVNVGME